MALTVSFACCHMPAAPTAGAKPGEAADNDDDGDGRDDPWQGFDTNSPIAQDMLGALFNQVRTGTAIWGVVVMTLAGSSIQANVLRSRLCENALTLA
jgi:hypothetical protein